MSVAATACAASADLCAPWAVCPRGATLGTGQRESLPQVAGQIDGPAGQIGGPAGRARAVIRGVSPGVAGQCALRCVVVLTGRRAGTVIALAPYLYSVAILILNRRVVKCKMFMNPQQCIVTCGFYAVTC